MTFKQNTKRKERIIFLENELRGYFETVMKSFSVNKRTLYQLNDFKLPSEN